MTAPASCVLASGLSFCSQVNYAIPIPSGGNAAAVRQQYDDRARSYFNNFTELLRQYDCTEEYSFQTSCARCATAYKDWLCAVTVPRCVQTANPSQPQLAERNVLMRESDSVRAVNGTGRWQEQLPCIGLCYRVMQSCPTYFGFDCPDEKRAQVASYGQRLAPPGSDKDGDSEAATPATVECNTMGLGEGPDGLPSTATPSIPRSTRSAWAIALTMVTTVLLPIVLNLSS